MKKKEAKATELIANIFIFVQEGKNAIVHEIGVVWHRQGGTDIEKIAFLQSQVDDDWPRSKRRPLPQEFWILDDQGVKHRGVQTYSGFQETFQKNQSKMLEFLVFKHYSYAPKDPLVCITPIVNGKVRVEGMSDLAGNSL